MEAILILIAIYVAYRLIKTNVIDNQPDPEVKQIGWEPLLPEEEYQKWPGHNFPYFVCPRCHSRNTTEDYSKSETKTGWSHMSSYKFVHYYKCNYCGYEFKSDTYSGKNPHW